MSQPRHIRHESNPSGVSSCPKKRLIVCCDGTWQDADSSRTPPSNVTEIVRAIPPIGKDHETGNAVSQVVFYQNGVGTGSAGWYQKYIGSKVSGATGEGLVFNVREAYAFLCTNYHEGDEIILMGFSRGAFTARTISTLIKELGLLTSKGMAYLVQIVDDWKHQLRPEKPEIKIDIWKNRPRFRDVRYREELLLHKLTRPNIPIKAVAVWDTVGALGVPSSALHLWMHKAFHRLCPKFISNRLPRPKPRKFAFVDTKVGDNIEYAFHALGIDEKRESFTPTVWHKPEGQQLPKILKQTWFPGVHSDVGGSYENNDNSILTLAWIMGQLETNHILCFNEQHIFRMMQRCVRGHLTEDAAWDRKILLKHHNANSRLARSATFGTLTPWGTGKIHDSYAGFMKLGGVTHRTPMEYTEISQTDREVVGRRLRNTGEKMHQSVRVRLHPQESVGYASEDIKKLEYWSAKDHVLKGWKDGWKSQGVYHYTKNVGGDTLEILEDELTDFEKRVQATWQAIDMSEDTAKLNTADGARAADDVLDFARVDEIGTPADLERHHLWKSQTFVEADTKFRGFVSTDAYEEEEHHHNHQETQSRDFAAHGRPTVVA